MEGRQQEQAAFLVLQEQILAYWYPQGPNHTDQLLNCAGLRVCVFLHAILCSTININEDSIFTMR